MTRRAAISMWLLIAATPAMAATHAVVLRNGAWTNPGEDCKGVERAWVWSDDAAPEAVEGAKVCEKTALAASAQKLAVKVVPRDRRATITLVAAPVAMWREVPEALLPRFELKEPHTIRVPHDGRSQWRVRAIGAHEGTPWTDVAATQRSVHLGSAAASTRTLHLLAQNSEPAANAEVRIVQQRAGAKPEITASFLSDARGRASFPALPDLGPLHFVTQHRAHAVDAFTATTAELPMTRQLAAGSRIRGRFLANDSPLAGVNVNVETWVAGDIAQLFTTKATTGSDGTFVVEHLPRRAVALVAAKSGYLPHRVTLELNDDELDLGKIALERGGTITILVVDDANQPVANAKLDAGSGRTAISDAKGRGRLADVSVKGSVRVAATADGHLRETVELRPPFDDARVRLPRGYVVQGRFTDSEHVPVPRASIRIENGSSYRVEAANEDGSFSITLPPAKDAKLMLSAPMTSDVVVSVPAGNPGEVRDLGTLAAPKGLSVSGRVVAADGTPLTGARIWSPKQTAQGPLVAFMNGELVETSSDATGAFTVSGLKAMPLVLRVDAPGYARAWRNVHPEGSIPTIPLGDVVLTPGATLKVSTKATDSMARVDVRGEGLDIDMQSAAVRNGVATIPHVANGPATITVIRDRRTVCEKRISIDRDEVTVECDPSQTAVQGTVLVGTTPARGGVLTWSSSNRPRVGAAIMERTSANGLRQQQVWGASDAPLSVSIDDSGHFETKELRPGLWDVAYGGSTQQVEIPEREEFSVALRFNDTTVSGVIVGRDGTPVPRAVVEVLTANAMMLARDDGTFELRGLIAGEHEVRARSHDGRTALERVRIEEGRDAPPLRLVLEAERPAEVRIAVLRGGQPSPGAFVFVELENEGQRILTADAAGLATLRIAENSRAQRLRLAGFDNGSWSFGPWRSRDESSITVSIDRGGDLAIGGASGQVEIVRYDGWNVSQLLRRIGVPPRVEPSAPLRLSGLAPGNYTVAVGTKSLQAEVAAGRSRELSFD